MKITTAIIPSGGNKGQSLLQMIMDYLNDFNMEIEILPNPTQSQVIRKSIVKDLIILDATIELNGQHNYAAFSAQPAAMDHILVVSRTYLPMNFHGLREGGAPKYPNQLTNEQIMHWLRSEIQDILPNLPRPKWHKKIITGSILTPIRALKAAASKARENKKIFISYRSKNIKEVQQLIKNIEKGKYHETPCKTLILEPGELAYQDEILSPLQRWHILSIIEERLRSVKEFWIHETDEYYNSWWTLGEIVLISYFQAVSGNRPILKIFRSIIKDGESLEIEPSDILPTVTYEQKRTLDRLLSYSGRTMGAETSKRMREIATLPIIGRSKFFADPVFSFEFFNDRFMELQSLSRSKYEKIDLDKFLQMELPPLIPVPEKILQEVKRNGYSYFENYKITEDQPRYMWYATRMGKLNGPENTNETTLAKLPVFRAKET